MLRKSRFSAVFALVLLTLVLLFVRIETGVESPRFNAGVPSTLIKPETPPTDAKENIQDGKDDAVENKKGGLKPVGAPKGDDAEDKKGGLQPIGIPTPVKDNESDHAEEIVQVAFEFQKEYLLEHDDPTL